MERRASVLTWLKYYSMSERNSSHYSRLFLTSRKNSVLMISKKKGENSVTCFAILLPGGRERVRESREGTEGKGEVPPANAETTQPLADDTTLSRQPSRHDACSDRR